MSNVLAVVLLDTCSDCFEFMKEPLTNYELFSGKLAERIKVKAGNNEQFSFDVELDQRVRESLIRQHVSGWVFSEESGVYTIPGGNTYRVVYDPFCNSSLASRTFREGAFGISIFSFDYQFLASAVLDFQTGLLALVMHGEKTKFYQVQTRQEVVLDRPYINELDKAWVVLTLENADERSHIAEGEKLLHQAGRIISSSGHIYWLKLSAGFIDAYADPFGGEQLYEMFACTIAQGAGCVVTDREGKAFDPGKHLRIFEQNPGYIFYPVAARTPELHKQLLDTLG